jgi:DUF971 family protein
MRPIHITLNKSEKYLEIVWDDGQVCRYPLPHLREACPCVVCRGGHEFMGPAYDPDDILKLTPARSYNLVALAPVGSYALQPTWDDGHNTGIYTWEYLRRICPSTSSVS